MKWQNRLTENLGVTYPIVQAPMLGVTTPEMVAAVSNAGGLGSLPIGGFAPEKARRLIQKVKQLTLKPFAVNLFAHEIPAIDYGQVTQMQTLLQEIGAKYGFSWQAPKVEELSFYNAQDQLEVLLAEKVPIVSFTFGVLQPEMLAALKYAGTYLIGTATCLDEALHLQELGVSAITMQGIEAGGHRGTFLHSEELPQISLQILLREAQQIQIPVIAAGGIMDGTSIRAALILGAQGVQLGSAFLRCPESGAPAVQKQAVAQSKDTSTVLTRAYSGRWARGIKTTFIHEIDASHLEACPYPVQDSLTKPMREKAKAEENAEFLSMWAGQAAYQAKDYPAELILKELVQETEQAFAENLL